jgi:hypothetical protein
LDVFAETNELRLVSPYLLDAEGISRWKNYLLVLKTLKIMGGGLEN